MRPSARARRPVPRKKARRPDGGPEALRARLREAEQTIDAIRSGQVDALVLRSPDGETVYALETADRPYRVLVEQMAAGRRHPRRRGADRLLQPEAQPADGRRERRARRHPLRVPVLRGAARRGRAASWRRPARPPARSRPGSGWTAGSPPCRSARPRSGSSTWRSWRSSPTSRTQKEKAALVAAREALQRADRQKDEFLATLAHELRNPLAPIRNTVSLLQSRLQPGSEALPGIEVIERQVEHMALLLDDLLDVSQLTRGAMRAAQGAGAAAAGGRPRDRDQQPRDLRRGPRAAWSRCPSGRSCSRPTRCVCRRRSRTC